ncbi:MAG: Gfo/Idh/MocA family protein, partial [Myxococcota bacterium]
MAVVGVGHMGRFHAEKIAAVAAEDGSTELVAVTDSDAERARIVGAEFGVPGEGDLDAVLAKVDAIVVAVPTVAHAAVVARALDAGVDVLIEKPIAATLEEAEKLLATARERGRVVQVGHLEWFNAAMQSVRDRVTRPRFIEAHRMGPFPARATDVDVVRDLMIHDIDIIQRLVGEEPERVDSIGVPVITDKVDIANARLTFPSGAVANVTASRVTPTPMRKIRFFQPDGYFSIDFGEQSVVIASREPAGPTGEREVKIETIEI